jgi:hypothetical protein
MGITFLEGVVTGKKRKKAMLEVCAGQAGCVLGFGQFVPDL